MGSESLLIPELEPHRHHCDDGRRPHRWTVEQCDRLDISKLRRDGFFTMNENMVMTRQWTSGWRESAAYLARVESDGQTAIWVFTKVPERGVPFYMVLLETTIPHFGGRRWWFSCPIHVGGQPCGRRCRILYRPPDSLFFGCRDCHWLTYRSRAFHRNGLFEALEAPTGRAGRLLRDLDSRSPRRRLRALARLDPVGTAEGLFDLPEERVGGADLE